MAGLYPPIELDDAGMLDVGDGALVYWETCGNPSGKPAIVLHGGPGSGCMEWHRRLFDPRRYRVVLFDQRGCGRSTPHASLPEADLATNTTWALVRDIEALRRHLGIERWLVLGGSWGSTLALAYAERHPDRVAEVILFGVTTGRRKEFDWWFRGGAAVLFPAQWERLCAAVPKSDRPDDIVDAYSRMLHHPDRAVRQRAATAWCMWESSVLKWPPAPRLAPRFADPAFAIAFARLVTHYVRHNAWIDDDALLRNAAVLTHIPGVMVQGRLDLGAPIAWAWDLHRVWPGAELIVVEDEGHNPTAPGITGRLVGTTDRFATPPV